MKQTILNMSKRTKSLVFGGAYAVLVLAAVFPPLYFSASGNGTLILGRTGCHVVLDRRFRGACGDDVRPVLG